METTTETALGELFTLMDTFRNAADGDELAHMIVSRLHRFIPYDSALFWTPNGDVVLASDTMSMPQAETLAQYFTNNESDKEIMVRFSLYDEPYSTQDLFSSFTGAASAIYVPILYGGQLYGGLILLRETAWSPAAQTMLSQCGQAAAYSLAAQQAGVHGAGAMRGTLQQWLIASAFIALFIAGIGVGVFLL